MNTPNQKVLAPVKAIIFDMDGTLYRHPLLNQRYNQSIYKMVADTYQVPLPEAHIVFEKAFNQQRTRLRREPSKLFVLNKLGISDLDWSKQYGKHVAPDKWLKPNRVLRKTLLHLQQRFKLAVVTNNHDHNTKMTLAQLNILDCFDAVQTLSETRLFKPSSKLYSMICKTLMVDPSEAISIGDRYDLDLAPAAAIGMQTFLVSTMNDIYALAHSLKPKLATKVKLTLSNYKEPINKCYQILKKGQLAIIPTDTVYGLASQVTQASVDYLYRAKGRDEKNPIVLLIDHPSQAERFVKVSGRAKQLMERHWPGALTLVLPTKAHTDWGAITRGHGMIGLRLPNHDFCQKLIKRAGGALATTSANPTGAPAPQLASKIDKQILGFAEILVDGGKTKSGISSTVAKVVGTRVEILRPGQIKL